MGSDASIPDSTFGGIDFPNCLIFHHNGVCIPYPNCRARSVGRSISSSCGHIWNVNG